MPRWFASGWGRSYPLIRLLPLGLLLHFLVRSAWHTAQQRKLFQIGPIGNVHSSESYAFPCGIADKIEEIP